MVNPSVRMLQIALNTTGERLKVDGIYGKKTHQALERSQTSVGDLFSNLAERAQAEYDRYLAFKKKDREWYTLQQLDKYIAEASTLTGVPAKTLEFFITHEASRRTRGGKTEFDARSKAGRFRGLCQMSSESWSDAARIAQTQNVNLGSFNEEAYDPARNILACAFYILFNRELAARQDVANFTPEIDYALHNQGHTFVARVRRGAYHQIGAQSDEAVATIKKAIEQLS